jgi:transposase InsO family protein
MSIGHGNSEFVAGAKPSLVRVQLDLLIVHRGLVFQKEKVWFHVYEGALADAMISDDLLNEIPCVTSPGATLVDTRARPDDMSILLRQINDYQDMCTHRISTAIASAACTPATSHAMNSTSSFSDVPAAMHFCSNTATSAAQPPEPPLQTEHERINALLAEMTAQRALLAARLGKPVSPEALQACLAVLDRFPDNFRPPGPDPCKLGVYRIVLKDKSKFHVALPRRVNPVMLAEIRRQVEELVAVGSIERCSTRPSSVYAIVMARRPNAPGKYRLCIDLSPGNENTVPNPYAVPEIQQALDRLSGHKLYSTFDFSSWFSQFELSEEDRDKMAFVVPGDNLTPPQIYRYKRVCFGALNATYFCQRQLQEALEVFPGCQSIYPFVDDIVLFADSLDEMLQKLESFMLFCRHYNLRLNKAKTELASTAVRHVGFILSEEGQSLDPARIDSLLNIGAPKNVDGLKSLLGSFGFIRGWLADMAGIAAPLTDLMSGTAHRLKFEWGPKQDAALAALKLAASLSPAKMAPDYDLPFEVYVDASDVGVAAVLVQWRLDADGIKRPMAILHKSRRWADREAKWEVACREMYALRYGLFEFREYLQGCPNVSVFSDHLNLVNGLWKHSNPKIVRWRMFLESMRPFTLRHIRGTDQMQMAADSLSRLHIKNLDLPKNEEEKDPAVIRMMERGEGEDDEPMFNDELFAKTANTQTEFLQALYSNTVASRSHRVPSEQEQTLANNYGVGFNIMEQMGWSATSHKNPVQLVQCQGRSGIGFKRSHSSAASAHSATSHPTPAPRPCSIISCVHVADWLDDGDRRASLDHDDDEYSANLMTATSSSTLVSTTATVFNAATTTSSSSLVLTPAAASEAATTTSSSTLVFTPAAALDAAATTPSSLPVSAPTATPEVAAATSPPILVSIPAAVSETVAAATSSPSLVSTAAAAPEVAATPPPTTVNITPAVALESAAPTPFSNALPGHACDMHSANPTTRSASAVSAVTSEQPAAAAPLSTQLASTPATAPESAASAPSPALFAIIPAAMSEPAATSLPSASIGADQSTATTPQDFKDAAYSASGGFPMAELLKRAHDNTHPGFITTWRRVIRAVGPQSTSEAAKTKDQVRRYCDACICCQKLQPARAKLLADIGSIRQRPFTSYAFDVITLSQPDLDGVRYILCCVDSFSRAVELYGLKQANAPTVLECLIDVLSRWGRAAELRCDNAKAFTSALVTALLKRIQVKQHLTAPYSHQSNGQVENCNRRVMDVLRAMVLDDRLGPNTQAKWSMLLPEVRRVLMTRIVTQHGLTPNDLAYMHCPETEASIFEEELWMPPHSTDAGQAEPEWLVKLEQQHQHLIDICDEKQSELLNKLAELNHRNREQQQQRSIQVHDFVLVKLTDRPQQKAQPRWSGPYLVVSFPDNDSTRLIVTLQHLSTKVVGEFHVSMLKFCDMSLMKQIEDAIPYAAKDSFEYEIEAIMQHTPTGPRKTAAGLRSKNEYEFKVLWKDIPIGPDNPSWEPYSNDSMRQCAPYQEYIRRPEIAAALGSNF